MSTPRRITVLLSLLSGLAVMLAAPAAAFADEAPDGSGGVIPAPPPATIITRSSPAWTFVLVALAAAAITAVVVLTVEHYRHRHTAPSPA